MKTNKKIKLILLSIVSYLAIILSLRFLYFLYKYFTRPFASEFAYCGEYFTRESYPCDFVEFMIFNPLNQLIWVDAWFYVVEILVSLLSIFLLYNYLKKRQKN